MISFDLMEVYLKSESGFFFNLNTLSYILEEHIILQRALQLKFKLEKNNILYKN